MKKKTMMLIGVSALVLCSSFTALAEREDLRSLRGEVGLDTLSAPPAHLEYREGARIERSFPQQPPLIPHGIEGYECGRDANDCLGCHAMEGSGAPAMSVSHFTDREGHRLKEVSSLRFSCTQCHVPQVDAPPLVENTFRTGK